MTTMTTNAVRVNARAGLGGALGSEWTKIRTVRSTRWSIAAMAGIAVGLNALISWLAIDRRWDQLPPEVRDEIVNNPLDRILTGPMSVAQFAVAVIGVMAITSEYATGMIRSTFQAQPRRLVILTSKIMVLGALMLVVGETLSFAAFFVGRSVIAAHVHVSMSDPGVLRAVFGGGLYITVLALFSLAVGALIRHTAGGIAVVLGLVLVISNLTQLLPDSWGHHLNAWMPTNAGSLIFQQHVDAKSLLTPWQGIGVFAGETVLLLILAGWLLHKRDA
jgi:ABC-type transport system involved in multi-copper enzyme maturation permease subunit